MELVSLKEWLCLYNVFNPQGETTINKIQTKTMLQRLFKVNWEMLCLDCFDFELHTPKLWLLRKPGPITSEEKHWSGHVVEIITESGERDNQGKRKKKGRKNKWKREMGLWEKIRAWSQGTCDRWSSWISCLSLCDSGCCGHFVCSDSTMEEKSLFSHKI